MPLSFSSDKLKPLVENGLNISNVDSDIEYTNLYVTKNHKPIMPVIGEFHFSRYPNEQWEDEILKMKAGGIDIISTYLFWIYHEENMGEFNFSGDNDLKKFLSLCEKHKMYVLLRLGPWCHGEVVYGGFPKFIKSRNDKRSNSPAYLKFVKIIYKKYYEQSKDFFYQNGSIVVGIQLENEYGGRDKNHLSVLRQLAVEAGFLLPLYTITAWPVNGAISNDCMPMFGGYPERPWDFRTTPLPTDDRFKISKARIDEGVGADLLKHGEKELDYSDFPYSTCELGCGNQVTEHRRPIISTADAYAMLIIQLAQGVNCLGYYMYHGGKNPYGGAYQESRRTGYPNNCPVISYDFQSPIGEYGYLRESYHKMKLVHYMLSSYGDKIAAMQPVFASEQNDLSDRVAIRTNENKEGLLFVNNYQRLEPYSDINDLEVKLDDVILPKFSIKSGKSLIFPFNCTFGSEKFDFISAQPICKNGNKFYFMAIDDIPCNFYKGGDNKIFFTAEKSSTSVPAFTIDDFEYYVLSESDALTLYNVNGKVIFTKDSILPYPDKIEALHNSKLNGFNSLISLKEVKAEKMPYDYYLYSIGKKKQYELTIDKNIFKDCDDIKILLSMTGNVADIYCGGVLMADYFNIDNVLTIGLRRFKSQIEKGLPLIIKVSPLNRFRKVYFEVPMERGKADLKLLSVTKIERLEISDEN
ncbi:MAG: beta-galactosidase [Oscillospiraceae bacterium]